MTPENITKLIDALVQSWNANGKAAEISMDRIQARIALDYAIGQLAQPHPQPEPVARPAPELLDTLRIACDALWQANAIPVAKHVQAVINEAEYGVRQATSDDHETQQWRPESEPGCSYA